MQDLYRYVALVTQIVREIDCRHSPCANLLRNAIPGFESCCNTCEDVTHPVRMRPHTVQR
jgi:hypothetical protein